KKLVEILNGLLASQRRSTFAPGERSPCFSALGLGLDLSSIGGDRVARGFSLETEVVDQPGIRSVL
ncbi:MAG: hypothetical protein M0Z39_09065, partial [Actinomycetota bacterium]|nr:hypothetical protein [Actinomycetota bacterium]